jgi:hypothetical protein
MVKCDLMPNAGFEAGTQSTMLAEVESAKTSLKVVD